MVAVQRALALRPLSHHALGQHLSDAFHAKWITGVPADVGAELEGSADPSTVADYGATFATRSLQPSASTLSEVNVGGVVGRIFSNLYSTPGQPTSMMTFPFLCPVSTSRWAS